MKIFWLLFLAFVSAGTGFCAGGRIGMNTYYFDSWTAQIAFVDAMMQFSRWVASTQGTDEWDSGETIPLGPKGFPLEIPYTPPGGKPQIANANIFSGIDNHFPKGVYTLLFEGTGSITVASDAGIKTFTRAGTHQVEVIPGRWGITVRINQSLASDPVRNIRLILPGFAGTYKASPFYPPFLERLKGFHCIRATHPVNFGTWPCDNGAKVTDAECVMKWATRSTTDYHPQAGFRGLAAEYHVDIANAAGADLWACVVHGADDDFIRQYAGFLRDRLDSNRKIYIELSNETWNGSADFPQQVYFKNLGTAQGLDDSHDEKIGRDKAFVRRCGQVFKIFEEVFSGQPGRLVRVLPSQFPYVPMTRQRLVYMMDSSVNTSGTKADALAVGAYFGGHVPDEIAARREQADITVDQILDLLESSITQDQPSAVNPGSVHTSFLTRLKANVQLADSFGVKLISYEGGPYPTLAPGNQKLTGLHAKIVLANRSPRMEKIYHKMLDLWFEHTDGIFMAFPYVGMFAGNALSGHLEWMDQPLDQAPKFRALRNYLNNGKTGSQVRGEPQVRDIQDINVRLSGTRLEISNTLPGPIEIRFMHLDGSLVLRLIVSKKARVLQLPGDMPGWNGNEPLLWQSAHGNSGLLAPAW